MTAPGDLAAPAAGILALWPRSAALVKPDGTIDCVRARGTSESITSAQLQSLGVAANQGWYDEALCALDRAYVGWTPGLEARFGPELAMLRAEHGRRSWLRCGRAVWPTLPSCAVRRAALALRGEPQTALLVGDIDGVSLALSSAGRCDVDVIEPSPLCRSWLTERARSLGLFAKLRHFVQADDSHLRRVYDVALVSVGASAAGVDARWDADLSMASTKLAPGGRLVASVRGAWHEAVEARAAVLGLRCVQRVHCADFGVLPGPFVGDHGADLLVFDKFEQRAHATTRDESHSEWRNPAPSHWLDLGPLAPSALACPADESLGRLLDLLALWAPHTEAQRSIDSVPGDDSRWIFNWSDTSGTSVAGDLRRTQGFIFAIMSGADVALEHAFLAAARLVLGDASSRVRARASWVAAQEVRIGH